MRWDVAAAALALGVVGLGVALAWRERTFVAERDANAAAFAHVARQLVSAQAARAALKKDAADRAQKEAERAAKAADAKTCVIAAGPGWSGRPIWFRGEGGAAEFWRAYKRDEPVDVLNLILKKQGGYFLERDTPCSLIATYRERTTARVRITEGPLTGREVYIPNAWRYGGSPP